MLCDASSLAIGVVLYVDRVGDQSWLQSVDDGSHINVAELELVFNGISLAVSWKMKCFRNVTDFFSVFNYVKSIIGRNRNIKTRCLSEVLVRRRLKLIEDTINEYHLQLSISLVSLVRTRLF